MSDVFPPERPIEWDKTFRLIPSRYPPIDLFERIADPADWEILAEIEGLTNARLRDEIGQISLVTPNERISGPGASPIMAAFTHIGFPSRFTDGSYGVYYASESLDGALAEVIHHTEKFLRGTSEPDTMVQMRLYVGSVATVLHDIRGGWPEAHDPESYSASQALGAALRAKGSNGLAYRCVRASGISNIAVFRPKAVASPVGKPHVAQGAHMQLHWNGQRIVRFIKMGDLDWTILRADAADAFRANPAWRAGGYGDP